MAGRCGKEPSRSTSMRRCGVIVGGAVSAFVAAAAMATGAAAPAKADFDALIDPIIQPIVSSLTESLAAFDPAAALDFTSWTDSLLSSLNSIDLALPSTDTALAAATSGAEPAASLASGTYELPITFLGSPGTEPAVYATIDGSTSSVPLLVDTGSSGLVIPYTDLGDNWFSQLENLFQLGFPTNFGESGYSGGVEYIYATYNDVPVSYADGLTTNGPVDVELFSWPTSFNSPLNFQEFLSDNSVAGILGIGANTAGPTTSPFESAGFSGVEVTPTALIVNPSAPDGFTVDGAPISTLYETVTTGGSTTGSVVSDDVDSGGVYGTIPASLYSHLEPGSTITVYSGQGGTELYSYTVGASDTFPTSLSGTNANIDSGYVPFTTNSIYLNYVNDTMTFVGK